MARNDSAAPTFADYFTIGEAAEFLGVSAATLRNWDRSGKLKPRRHPQNGYRIYLHEDLAAVLKSARLPLTDKVPSAPHVDWNAVRGAEHFVQFYESDEFLVEAACGFVGAALRDGEIAIVVATPDHRREIERKLAEEGIDLSAAEASGHYIARDARETLSEFMVGKRLDDERFDAVIGQMVGQLAENGPHIHAFGEMVAVLWEEGNREGAIALEQKWSVLAQQHQFALLCAYPIHAFKDDTQGVQFDLVCTFHTHIHPAESYALIVHDNARLHAVSKLQQQVHSLKAEIDHRQEIENSLREADRGQTERLARISTELRTPLAAIRLAVEELKTTTGSGGADHDATDVILHQVERLAERIDRLV
jgi:hypothetical protein